MTKVKMRFVERDGVVVTQIGHSNTGSEREGRASARMKSGHRRSSRVEAPIRVAVT
jgi:hypothetical protein